MNFSGYDVHVGFDVGGLQSMACNVGVSCLVGHECLFSVSNESNAHLGACDYYSKKVCCDAVVGSPVSVPMKCGNVTIPEDPGLVPNAPATLGPACAASGSGLCYDDQCVNSTGGCFDRGDVTDADGDGDFEVCVSDVLDPIGESWCPKGFKWDLWIVPPPGICIPDNPTCDWGYIPPGLNYGCNSPFSPWIPECFTYNLNPPPQNSSCCIDVVFNNYYVYTMEDVIVY